MKKNDIVELQIENYAFEGKGIAKIDQSLLNHVNTEPGKKYIIFVHNSYPGDIVKAKVLKLKKSFGEAKTVEILKSGPGRINAKCKHFGIFLLFSDLFHSQYIDISSFPYQNCILIS